MLKVNNVRIPVGEEEERLRKRVATRLGVRADEFREFRILRKSLDIRDKRRLEYVYTTAVGLEDEARFVRDAGRRDVSIHRPTAFCEPTPGSVPLEYRPVIVGAGPAGLFAALLLAEYGYAPLVLERGQPVRQRIRDVEQFDRGGPHDPESNYLFGEGGAGTFSDGKLTCRNTGPDTERVLRILAECKGRPSIVYESRPHLGSNRLPAVVKALRRRIEQFGGEVRFGARVDDLEIDEGRVQRLRTTSGPIDVEVVLLAIGHSARDTYSMLGSRGVRMLPKPFQMGVRIEQPQHQVTVAQYGTSPAAQLLGPADYTMNVRVSDRELFTFCMCAGGYVMPSVSTPEHFCTNGMSRSNHESPFANSGLVVTVDPATLPGVDSARPDAFAGMRHQAALEHAAYRMTGGTYEAPIQSVRDFLAERPTRDRPPSSYARGVRPVNLWDLLPTDLAKLLKEGLPAMDRRWNGRFLRDATLVGPESRGSCPVRIPRDEQTRQAIDIGGLYPIGEGAGYAGGIVSAAVDGLRSARCLIGRHRPLVR